MLVHLKPRKNYGTVIPIIITLLTNASYAATYTISAQTARDSVGASLTVPNLTDNVIFSFSCTTDTPDQIDKVIAETNGAAGSGSRVQIPCDGTTQKLDPVAPYPGAGFNATGRITVYPKVSSAGILLSHVNITSFRLDGGSTMNKDQDLNLPAVESCSATVSDIIFGNLVNNSSPTQSFVSEITGNGTITYAPKNASDSGPYLEGPENATIEYRVSPGTWSAERKQYIISEPSSITLTVPSEPNPGEYKSSGTATISCP